MLGFKSRKEKQLERDIKIRQGVGALKRQIVKLEQSSAGFAHKAHEAKEIDANDQYTLARTGLRHSAMQKKMLERQLLTIQISSQMKDMAQSQGEFICTLTDISAAMKSVFKTTNVTHMQMNFEKAMAQCQTMEQKIDLFLDMAQASFTDPGAIQTGDNTLVSDAELDAIIGKASTEHARTDQDRLAIDEGLIRVREAMGQESEVNR